MCCFPNTKQNILISQHGLLDHITHRLFSSSSVQWRRSLFHWRFSDYIASALIDDYVWIIFAHVHHYAFVIYATSCGHCNIHWRHCTRVDESSISSLGSQTRSKHKLDQIYLLDPGSLFLRNKSYWIHEGPSKSVQVSSCGVKLSLAPEHV